MSGPNLAETAQACVFEVSPQVIRIRMEKGNLAGRIVLTKLFK